MADAPLLAPSIPMFDELAVAVGFRRLEKLSADAPEFLAMEVWESDFAIVALVRVSKTDLECLSETFNRATRWLSHVLEMEETRGRLIDGYLLLALPRKPEKDLLVRVREIERDTSICRKHILWPGDDHSWSTSLNAVTTLGLPPAAPLVGVLTEPALPAVATQALDARENGASFYDVATMIEDMPEVEQNAG